MTSIQELLGPVALLLEIAGVAAILVATVLATFTYARALRRRESERNAEEKR